MNGITVDNTVMGGPAYNSKQITHGDVILKVNGTIATKDNILDLLVGNDIPGSPVELRVAKGGIKASTVDSVWRHLYASINAEETICRAHQYM